MYYDVEIMAVRRGEENEAPQALAMPQPRADQIAIAAEGKDTAM